MVMISIINCTQIKSEYAGYPITGTVLTTNNHHENIDCLIQNLAFVITMFCIFIIVEKE